MKDKANAVDQWFRKHRLAWFVILVIPIILGVRYLGEVIAAFLSGGSHDFSPWRGSPDTVEGWLGLLIATLVGVVFAVLVRYLFRRYVGKP